jgi:CBS domain-containing protein
VTATRRNPTSRWGSFFTIGSPAFAAARILVPPGEIMPICACVGATGLAWLPHPRLLMTALAVVATGVAVWRRQEAPLRVVTAFVSVGPRTTCEALRRALDLASEQRVIPVIDRELTLRGVIDSDAIRRAPRDHGLVAEDLMRPAIAVSSTSPVTWVRRVMAAHRLHALPVSDGAGAVVALVMSDR